MKKFFTTLFNVFCWSIDCVFFAVDLLIELLSILLNLVLQTATSIVHRITGLISPRRGTPLRVQKPRNDSYLGRGIYLFFVLCVQVVCLACIVQGFIPVRTVLSTMGAFFSQTKIQLCAMLGAFLLLLPQQQIFRDPVTRTFFRRGWFKNYGTAILFSKCLSFLCISMLMCGIFVK